MPTISFHSVTLLHIAYQARDRARSDANRPNALTNDSIVSIVMAIAAAEAFINELPECVRTWQATKDPIFLSAITPELLAMADALDEVEESKGSVTLKYQIAALTLSRSTFSKGEHPFQKFAEFVQLRNAVVHVKPAWSGRSHTGRRLADSLEQRGLTAYPDSSLSWLDKLMEPKVATEACIAAREIMLAILALTPDENNNLDPFKTLKDAIRNDVRFSP